MRKILLTILFCLVCVFNATVGWTETLVDSYSETNQDSTITCYSGSTVKAGQSFTAIAGDLLSCKFYIKKTGSPTGNATAGLYTHSGTYGSSSTGTGAVLATSDNFDVSTLITDLQLITFSFTGGEQYTLENGTYYCIVVEYAGGDSSNKIELGIDTSSPSHSGNIPYYTEFLGLGWLSNANDCCFYVYAEEAVAGVPYPSQIIKHFQTREVYAMDGE